MHAHAHACACACIRNGDSSEMELHAATGPCGAQQGPPSPAPATPSRTPTHIIPNTCATLHTCTHAGAHEGTFALKKTPSAGTPAAHLCGQDVDGLHAAAAAGGHVLAEAGKVRHQTGRKQSAIIRHARQHNAPRAASLRPARGELASQARAMAGCSQHRQLRSAEAAEPCWTLPGSSP